MSSHEQWLVLLYENAPWLRQHNEVTLTASAAGECNTALAQQALVLREHMAQRDAETSALADELRRAQVGLWTTQTIRSPCRILVKGVCSFRGS